MKTKLATALSIVGVLGAGSAAALVNTQILSSDASGSGASAAVLPPASTVALSVPGVAVDQLPVSSVVVTTPGAQAGTVPASPGAAAATASTVLEQFDREFSASLSPSPARPSSDAPATTAPTPTAPPTTSPAEPGPSGYLTAFNVGDAGVVTVDVVNGQLILVSAQPKAGWSVTKAEDDSNDSSSTVENEVEVDFTSATTRVEFEAHFVNGQIIPEVSSVAINVPDTTVPSTTVPSNGDDEFEDEDETEFEDEFEDEDEDEDEVEDQEDEEDEEDEVEDDEEDEVEDDD